MFCGDLLKKCFVKHDVKKGIYMLKFYGSEYQGQKDCVVLLDDFLPMGCWGGGTPSNFLAYNRPLGYRPNGKKKIDIELWATLLEAAYCKINSSQGSPTGSFKDNYGGHSQAAIMQLTGMNGILFRCEHPSFTPDALFEKIKAIGDGDIQCAGTPAMENNNQGHHGLTKNGLSPTHAYAILGYCQVDDLRLVKIMNPWVRDVVCVCVFFFFPSSFFSFLFLDSSCSLYIFFYLLLPILYYIVIITHHLTHRGKVKANGQEIIAMPLRNGTNV